MAYVIGIGHLGIGTNQHTLLRGVGIALGVAKVCRETQALASKIQAQHRHFAVDALVVPFSITGLLHAIEAHAELLAFTKATADVHCAASLAGRGVAAGEFGDRLVSGSLGLHVDTAAHAATRRNAVDQLAGAFDDVDPVGHFHVDRIGRQDAIETVVGHITVEQAEAANGELLETPARRVGSTH
ncbi:hypothetical protein D3C75_740370 [compost metagenome]